MPGLTRRYRHSLGEVAGGEAGGRDARERPGRVVYDDTVQSPQKLAEAIDKLGFKASTVSVTEVPPSERPARR